MPTLQEASLREFKQALTMTTVKSGDIMAVPLPDEVGTWADYSDASYEVKGVTETIYADLNDNIVFNVGDRPIVKRVVDNTGNFIRIGDIYQVDKVTIPGGSLPVLSDKCLAIPYKYKPDEPGYGYVDTQSDATYMYYLPKSVLYPVSLTALAISTRSLKVYQGIIVQTWEYGKIWVSVIPYKPHATYTQTRILQVSNRLNYSYEVDRLMSFWVDNDIVPHPGLFVKDGSSMVLLDRPVDYFDFTPISSIPMKEELDSVTVLPESR